MTEYKTQIYIKDGPVARVWFNRPEARNATNAQFYKDLILILEDADRDPAIRVIVLGGKGPVFCAGQDLKFTTYATPEEVAEYGPNLRKGQGLITYNSKPVIARVQGAAMGGGMMIATRSDLIVARKDTRFAMREIFAGAQSGGWHLLSVGKQRSLEINLLARIVTGEEAERWNLINKAVDTDEEMDAQIDDWIEQLINLPPLGLKATKEATNLLMNLAGWQTLLDAGIGSHLRYTEDSREAKLAWNEKRKPNFKGR